VSIRVVETKNVDCRVACAPRQSTPCSGRMLTQPRGWLPNFGQRLRDTCAIGRIGPGAVGDMALLDMPGGATQRAGGVLEEHLPLRPCHHPEKVARLFPMVIVNPVALVQSLAAGYFWGTAG
jgi:hypothetical protein